VLLCIDECEFDVFDSWSRDHEGNDHKIESRVIGKIFLAEVFAGCGFI
jgi:hypothetical protein